MKIRTACTAFLLAVSTALFILPAASAASRQVIDATGRSIELPGKISRIICSGSGCLRLISYFNAQDRVVAVDDMETRDGLFDARPYALANPRYKTLPVFGGFRGNDDPEKILGLEKQPQVIFKTYTGSGHDPVELEEKTGIPVVILEYGDLLSGRKKLYHSLTLIGEVLDKQPRAEALIRFFTREIDALDTRTKDIPVKKTCFVGGIAFRGPHGFQSTEPAYPPFQFIHADNIADTGARSEKQIRHSSFSKEKLLAADPQVLFLDLSTLQMGEGHGGLHELRNDPVYQALTAVATGQVYGVLPYNWYTQNFGSILADAWYIGKTLYPDRFKDIDPAKNADRIYEFLLSARVFDEMNARFKKMAFKPVLLTDE